MERSLNNHLKALQHLSKVINDLDNVQEIASVVTKDVIKLLGYENCVIYKVNEKELTLEQISVFEPQNSVNNTVVSPLKIPIGSKIVGNVAKTGKPIIVHNADEVEKKLIDDKKCYSEIAIPIKVKNEVIAVIDSKNSRKNFYTESDLITLTTIANLISLQLNKALKDQKASNDILELQEVLKLILSHSKSAIMMEDLDNNILIVNKTFCNAVDENLTPEKFQGLSTLDFADAFSNIFPNKEDFIEKIKKLKAEKKIVLGEQIKTSNGKFYQRDFIPVKVDKQNIGYYWQYNDVTETINQKRQMQKALETEKKFNRLNKNLISIASHELRTPLTSIKSTADLILSKTHKYDLKQIIHRIRRIKRASNIMSKLLENIMTLGEVDNFKTEENDVTELTLNELINMIHEIKEDHIPDRKLIIQSSNAESPILQTYKSKLYLVIKNILSNADKYSDPELPVLVNVSIKPSHVEISVLDKGIGIPKDQLDKIFQSFSRGSNVKDTIGTGLGLAIVKRALEILNGTITISSEPNQGTTVKICIPFE